MARETVCRLGHRIPTAIHLITKTMRAFGDRASNASESSYIELLGTQALANTNHNFECY